MLVFLFFLIGVLNVSGESVSRSHVRILAGGDEDFPLESFSSNILATKNPIQALDDEVDFLRFVPSLSLTSRLFPPFTDDFSSIFLIHDKQGELYFDFYLGFDDPDYYYRYLSLHSDRVQFHRHLKVKGNVSVQRLGELDYSLLEDLVINRAYLKKNYTDSIHLSLDFGTTYLDSSHTYYNHNFGTISMDEVQTAMVHFVPRSDQEYMDNFTSVFAGKTANVSNKFKIEVPRFMLVDLSRTHFAGHLDRAPILKVLYANQLKLEYYPLVCEDLKIKEVLYTQDFFHDDHYSFYSEFKGPSAGEGENPFSINGIRLEVDFLVPFSLTHSNKNTPFGFSSNIHSRLSIPVLREDMASESSLPFSTWDYSYSFHNDFVEKESRVLLYGSLVSTALQESVDVDLTTLVHENKTGTVLLRSASIFSGSTVTARDRLLVCRQMIFAVTGRFETIRCYLLDWMSDIRLKTAIRPLKESFSLNQFNLYDYFRKEDIDRHKKEVGVIAQEVEKWDSRLVVENDQGLKFVKLSSLMMLFIHEFQESVRQKKMRLASLQSRIALMKQVICDLKGAQL